MGALGIVETWRPQGQSCCFRACRRGRATGHVGGGGSGRLHERRARPANGWTSGGAFAAANRFTFSDLGSPGAGVDAVDVNYYGAVGVAIPGGFFDDGDIVYTP
ncbi:MULTISPECIES: hypothetical protein [Sorangium]|uniref:hypothetical protein n=1 Tax=Sorangium TaxID=39643 RepID=UPI0002EF8C66|nr:hypothetical protein [Sorangium cellulosum]